MCSSNLDHFPRDLGEIFLKKMKPPPRLGLENEFPFGMETIFSGANCLPASFREGKMKEMKDM